MLTYAVHGSNIALVDTDSVLLLDVSYERAVALWNHKDIEPMKLESILDALMSDGLDKLPDFAFLEVVDVAKGLLSIVVRGSGVVYVGDESYTGANARTWVESAITDVVQAKLSLGETPDSAVSLPVERGIVQTNEVQWGVEPPEHFSETRIVQEHNGDTGAISGLQHNAFSLVADRSLRGHGHLVDEQTVIRRSVPNWMLRFTNGKVIGIGDRVVVGRRPTPISVNGEQLEQVLSPQKIVSSNHALLLGEADGGVIVDLDSTNGTLVHAKSGETFLVRDGAEFSLSEGDRLDFGDGNEAEFVRASLLTM